MERSCGLPETPLMRVDKLTMAHAVEARVPFLDHDGSSSRPGSHRRISSRTASHACG